MWHASVKARERPTACAIGHIFLEAVGDGDAWTQYGHMGAVHVRKRLTDAEMDIAGHPVDIRGTLEHRRRIKDLSNALKLPPAMLEEMG